MPPKKISTVTLAVTDLAATKAKVAALQKEAEATTKEIREGFVEEVIVFVDLVGSTQFKMDHAASPERWIHRLMQFGEVLAAYALQMDGRVIKYIGDEVMIGFEGSKRVQQAASFLLGLPGVVAEISPTEDPIEVKTAVDMGKAYMLEFDGHNEPDPQGTPVDRCARIGKYAGPGTVVTTAAFAEATGAMGLNWALAGNVDLKGLGKTDVYQLMLGKKPAVTIKLTDPVKELEKNLARLEAEKNALTGENAELRSQLKSSGKRPIQPPPSATTPPTTVEGALRVLNRLIADAGVPKSDYARFLFLHMRGEGQTWNKFEGRTFEACVEENLVREEGDNGFYVLDTEHKRNQRAIDAMDTLEHLLKQEEQDEDDLFDYSLKEPSYWKKIGYNVK